MLLDVGGDDDGVDVVEVDGPFVAPPEEFDASPGIGPSRIQIPYICGKELEETSLPKTTLTQRTAEIFAACQRLAQMPGMGLREDLTDEPLRFWPVYSYLIIYRPETQPLEIVRILHGARSKEPPPCWAYFLPSDRMGNYSYTSRLSRDDLPPMPRRPMRKTP